MHKAGAWVKAHFPGWGLHLWVFEANYPARRFYEQLGATNQGWVVEEVPGGDAVTSLRYVWPSVEPLLELKKDALTST